MALRNSPERTIQSAVCRHLRARARSEVVYWHTPNGGSRNIVEAVNLKRMGVMPGVSDWLLYDNKELFALELKAPGGRPSAEQLGFQSRIRNAGGHAVVAEGLDEALQCLEVWGLLR